MAFNSSESKKKSRVYHREERSHFEPFCKGEIDVLFATIALSCGMDALCCKFVLHVGFPEHLLDLQQSVGRCGRDSTSQCKVLILHGMIV